MNKLAIKVENLSKLYRIGEIGSGTITHDLNRWWHVVRGKPDPYAKIGEENKRDATGGNWVWALKDVDFEVKAGEVLGIIGKNGAGKSTLLKLLSRVTSPTTGSIKAKGRIASLLEVGTGFHPDLTGRENIFLNGAILGMTKQEIKRKFDEIVAFAGVERYIDTPVKRYSSGMYVRLAFAVAAHLESEILIVDEVLAVGDAEFQSKCLGKMKDVSNQDGKTVLFVSHNMGAVKNLCTRGMLMERGKVGIIGETNDVIDQYLSSEFDIDRYVRWDADKRPGDSDVKLMSIKILDDKGRTEYALTSESEIIIEITYEVLKVVKNLRVGATIMSSDSVCVFATSDYKYQDKLEIKEPGTYCSTFTIPTNTLNLSKYFVMIDIDIPFSKEIAMGKIASFTVEELITNQLGPTIGRKPDGVIHPLYKWHIIKLT